MESVERKGKEEKVGKVIKRKNLDKIRLLFLFSFIRKYEENEKKNNFFLVLELERENKKILIEKREKKCMKKI